LFYSIVPYIVATRCQFHQRWTSAFFVRTSFLCLEFGFERIFVSKIHAKNVDEIDHRNFWLNKAALDGPELFDNWMFSMSIPVADPIKLIFFANKEFLHFLLLS